MIVLEMKAVVKPSQCSAIDEAIRTVQFIRNKALRLWMDAKREDKIDKYSLNKYCAVLAKQRQFKNEVHQCLMIIHRIPQKGFDSQDIFEDDD